MKNFIRLNYNMYPKKIYKEKELFFFFSGNEKIYILKVSNDNLKSYIDISNQLYQNGVPISTFILNNKKEYLCKNNNYYIALLKYNDVSDNRIFLDDIIKYNINTDIISEYNIIKEWEDKIDTLEMEMTEYNKEFPIIQNSLDYFIGLSENGIQLIKSTKIINNSLAHNIHINDFNRNNYNNPLNIIKSNRMYDVAKYFKYKFYYDTIDYEELYKALNDKYNKVEDLIFFYSMMLYQEEFLEEVKLVLLNKKNENELNKYINKTKEYKELLKYIKINLHNLDYIKDIEWLDK